MGVVRPISFEKDCTENTQVLALLRGRLAMLEAIGQEEANLSCNRDAALLLVRRASHIVVEPNPKKIPKLLVIGVVAPKVPRYDWDPKHGLEPC